MMTALLEVVPELFNITLLLLHIPQLHDGCLLYPLNLGLLILQAKYQIELVRLSMAGSPTLASSFCCQAP